MLRAWPPELPLFWLLGGPVELDVGGWLATDWLAWALLPRVGVLLLALPPLCVDLLLLRLLLEGPLDLDLERDRGC